MNTTDCFALFDFEANVLLSHPAPSRAGSFERWTLLDALNHATAWKKIAMGKVNRRMLGKPVPYHDSRPIEEINRGIFSDNQPNGIESTKKCMEDCRAEAEGLLALVAGREDSTEWSPVGYTGTVGEYLYHDLVAHPMRHYLFFALSNDDIALFAKLSAFLAAHKDMPLPAVTKVKNLFDDASAMKKSFQKKSGAWLDHELFRTMKKAMSAS